MEGGRQRIIKQGGRAKEQRQKKHKNRGMEQEVDG